MIDLHLHSTHSDGTCTPEELVALGVAAGAQALALTDHDTMAGTEDFCTACRAAGIVGLVGVELSVDVADVRGTLHILGYGLDANCLAFSEAMTRVVDGRNWRNEQILARLNELGLELEWAEVAACAGDGIVGRPHFAQALMNRDYVFSMAEAFDQYLGKGAPAYVDRYRLSAEEAIGVIRAAGGVAVMAHPWLWMQDAVALEAALLTLKAAGLTGLEARYGTFTREQTVDLLRVAERTGLLVTAGSDFHGENKPGISIGHNLEETDCYLAPLLEAIAASKKRV